LHEIKNLIPEALKKRLNKKKKKKDGIGFLLGRQSHKLYLEGKNHSLNAMVSDWKE